MIVKVQQSLSTTAEKAKMMIYDRTKKHQLLTDLTDEVKSLLGDRPKAYFNAELVNKEFVLKDEVKNQDW